MAVTEPPQPPVEPVEHRQTAPDYPPPGDRRPDRARREWTLVAIGIVGLIAVLATVTALVALGDSGAATKTVVTAKAPAPAAASSLVTPAADDPAARGVEFEEFERVDPALPPVPAGAVKKFDVDVYQHVTQVSPDLAPTEVWSYAVNGVEHRGTGYSEPMVVEVGDTVDFTLTNGSTQAMKVTMPHSLDFHSAELDPGTHYGDIGPGESMHYRFVAKHPGVFMYHCATQPVLLHTGMGMTGAMVVKPKGLAPAKDFMVTQQEFYIGEPGGAGDMGKMEAKAPSAITFNGYANQYQQEPIVVERGERVRLWVLNAGPSLWSAFHVIGTVFDKTVVENVRGHSAQTINLAPSQGGYVELTLDQEGTYPFVTHAFGDAVKGAIGALQTTNAPTAGGGHDMGGHDKGAHS